MAKLSISGITPTQDEESANAFVEVLGPIPVDDNGDPLFTPKEFRDHCIWGYVKIILSQSRESIQKKSEVSHAEHIENEYGNIEK